MLYLAYKYDVKYVVYDSDDETIDYAAREEILKAYELKIPIFDFNIDIYESMKYESDFVFSSVTHGIMELPLKVMFGASKMFNSYGIRKNYKYNYMANLYELDTWTDVLSVYHDGYEYTVRIDKSSRSLDSVDGALNITGNVVYFGYDVVSKCPVIGTTARKYYLRSNFNEKYKDVQAEVKKSTWNSAMRKCVIRG